MVPRLQRRCLQVGELLAGEAPQRRHVLQGQGLLLRRCGGALGSAQHHSTCIRELPPCRRPGSLQTLGAELAGHPLLPQLLLQLLLQPDASRLQTQPALLRCGAQQLTRAAPHRLLLLLPLLLLLFLHLHLLRMLAGCWRRRGGRERGLWLLPPQVASGLGQAPLLDNHRQLFDGCSSSTAAPAASRGPKEGLEPLHVCLHGGGSGAVAAAAAGQCLHSGRLHAFEFSNDFRACIRARCPSACLRESVGRAGSRAGPAGKRLDTPVN